MMIFKKAIPRRTFLRGAGATLALPFLDAMVPAFAASDAMAVRPLRLGYVYLPVGRIMDNWIPRTVGTDFELSPTLAPLAPFRNQLLVLSGLDIKAVDLVSGERGDPHGRRSAAYLTGVHPKRTGSAGISVDQVVARQVGQDTPLGSLELNLDPVEWARGNETDFSGFYTTTLSWRTATTPLPTESNPRKVFERLFGDTDSIDPEAMRRRLAQRRSVLDSVAGQVNQLMTDVSANDRHKLGEYLDAVRDIERGIEVAESRTVSKESTVHTDITRPTGIPANYETHAKLMFDLMFLAYQTDMTRVVTFMLGHEGTNRNYLEVGAQDGHHSMSHHKGYVPAIELLKKVDLYQSQLLAYFLGKMQSTPDGEGTLLDNSLIVAGGALSDGNLHLHNNVPTALIGGAQGQLKGNRHIHYDEEPLSNLHMAVLDIFGVSSKDYKTSDATGILKGLS